MQIINHRVYGFNQFHCCNHHLLLHSQQQTKKGVRIMQELKKTFFHKKPPWTKASLILLQKDSASLKSPPCFSLTIITIQQADFGHHNQKFYQINFVALHKNVQMHRNGECKFPERTTESGLSEEHLCKCLSEGCYRKK